MIAVRSGEPVAAGARAMLPLLAGVAPFGVAIGASVGDLGVDPLAGWSTSWVIFSGTPQMLTLDLLGRGAAPLSIIVTVLLVNLRFTVYSAALTPTWREAPLRFRLVASYLLTDPVYAVAARHAESDPAPRTVQLHYLGSAMTLWVGWLAACGLGLAIGPRLTDLVPASLFLELILVGMLIPLLRGRPTRTAAVIAGLVALLCAALPAGLGPLVAATVGAAVAMRVTREAS